MVHLTNLSFSYTPGDEPAIQNLSLDLAVSSWTTLSGPDGSGKSTLLKLIAGLMTPQSGEIFLDLKDGDQVGFLGGDPYDWIVGLSVEEDIIFGLENLCLAPDEIEYRLEHALSRTGLNGMERRLVHTLSGGEQQRLALAAMLAMGSEIVLMDEVFTMLDRPARLAVRKLMTRLCRLHGLTILEATHSPEDIMASDRVIFLGAGRLIFDGGPDEFVQSPIGREWTGLVSGAANLKSQFLLDGSFRGVSLAGKDGRIL